MGGALPLPVRETTFVDEFSLLDETDESCDSFTTGGDEFPLPTDDTDELTCDFPLPYGDPLKFGDGDTAEGKELSLLDGVMDELGEYPLAFGETLELGDECPLLGGVKDKFEDRPLPGGEITDPGGDLPLPRVNFDTCNPLPLETDSVSLCE